MSTIIIVDRIGEGSSILRLASEIDGYVVQMSMSHWVREVCVILNRVLGHEHEILKIKPPLLENYIRKRIRKIPMFVE